MIPIRLLPALVVSTALLPLTAIAASPARPQIPVLDKPTIERQCVEVLARLTDLRASIARGGQGPVLAALNRLTIASENLGGPVGLIANVAPDAETRDAADACSLELSAFDTDTQQNDAIYKRIVAVKPKDGPDAALKQSFLESFEDSGITLDATKRRRVKAIHDRLDAIGTEFQHNLRADTTRVTITPAEATGLPDAWLAARPKDADGNLMLDLSNPTVVPFLDLATNADARRRIWFARQREGGDANIALLDEAVALRSELASLYDLPDYATFVLRRRMAGTPQAVQAFLADVKARVTDAEVADLESLRIAKATLLGTPLDQTRVERWDVNYLQALERKARFSIDQDALRRYFPAEAGIDYTMRIASTLYGIRFERRDVPVWHPTVRYYDVFEQSDGHFIGGIYLDLFPREGKFNHAAAWSVYRESRLAKRTPVSGLVANLEPGGLTPFELSTLLHEFGHVMHNILSTARYADLAGTSVRLDFVEAPSQMFEEWAYRAQSLALFAQVCAACPQLSTEQIDRIDRARRYGAGLLYSGQWQLAEYDMELATGAPRKSMDTWAALMKTRPLGYVEGTLFPASFGHLTGGYAAGYYSYMWSQVLELDMLSVFKDHMLDPEIGHRYRTTILAPGGEQPPMDLVTRFLGRAPNSDAFFAEIAGKR